MRLILILNSFLGSSDSLLFRALFHSLVPRLFSARSLSVFFFNDTATTEIYTLSLHDALPIFRQRVSCIFFVFALLLFVCAAPLQAQVPRPPNFLAERSEEHTSELQSLAYLVCRLLLEKKNAPHSDSEQLLGQ